MYLCVLCKDNLATHKDSCSLFCAFIIIASFLSVSYNLPASLVLVLQEHTTKPGLILLP